MKKLLAGLVIVVVGVAVFHFAKLPSGPAVFPPVTAKIADAGNPRAYRLRYANRSGTSVQRTLRRHFPQRFHC